MVKVVVVVRLVIEHAIRVVTHRRYQAAWRSSFDRTRIRALQLIHAWRRSLGVLLTDQVIEVDVDTAGVAPRRSNRDWLLHRFRLRVVVSEIVVVGGW